MSNTSNSTRPNVLLINVDQLSGLLTRPGGHPVCATPTLAQLASAGTYFTNAYSTCPTCIPARRSLMTGLTPRTHGDRTFIERKEMPNAPTLAQCFRDAGYQAHAVGKLHVHPQRDRIGFDEVISNEEGRHHLGDEGADDWELYLAEHGYAGQEYAAGSCNNDYNVTPWHLPEFLHPTRWAARKMCETIHRRDPRKPAFWYLSFVGPHPPTWPLQDYLEQYLHREVDKPVIGDWAQNPDDMPYALHARKPPFSMEGALQEEIDLARRAWYAEVTHIDHQIRVVIGCLREKGLLDNTIIGLVSDHGDMLGDHRLWAKDQMYEMSAKIPMLFVAPKGDDRIAMNVKDDRLVCLEDVMPTLLELAGLPVPEHVEGRSLVSGDKRDVLYGEHFEDDRATRMLRDDRYKLIYFPVGNRKQLFDLHEDPRETTDLAGRPEQKEVQQKLEQQLIAHLYDSEYGSDTEWVKDGRLVGLPDREKTQPDARGLVGQRGIRMMRAT